MFHSGYLFPPKNKRPESFVNLLLVRINNEFFLSGSGNEPILLASLVDLQKTLKRRMVSKPVRKMALRIQPH
jgi:hypothetical protein